MTTCRQNIRTLLPMLVLLLMLSSCVAKEIDSFNLLLPTAYHRTKGHARQFVTTSGECFDWQSTDKSIVSVKGTHQGINKKIDQSATCYANGIVELVHVGPYPASVYITARDRESGEVTSIPVRIRNLNKISIFTKSRAMNIKQIQNLQIFGFDSDNNTFTSLEGLRFTWTIKDAQNEGLIAKIPLRESSLYMPLDTRKKIEQQEKVESDLLIIKALKVGKVIVEARCLEPNYENITDSITLYIQERFEISPALPLNLLAGSKMKFHLLTSSGQNISLPSKNYQIQLSDSEFSVTDTLELSTPKWAINSNCKLNVSDIRTRPPFSAQAEVNVYQPDSIQILVDNEQIIIGEEVKYRINFYHKKMRLHGEVSNDDIRIRLIEAQPAAFSLDKSQKKITSFKKSTVVIEAEYNGLIGTKKIASATPIKAILPATSLQRKPARQSILLPVEQTYQLTVIGGNAQYKYSQINPSGEYEAKSIIALSHNGLITARKLGTTMIKVVDELNPRNMIMIEVKVTGMLLIDSLQQLKQFNLNEDGSLYLGIKSSSAGDDKYFTECNDALLKGLSLHSSVGGSPLQISSIYSMSSQIIQNLDELSKNHKFLPKVLSERSNPNSYITFQEMESQYLLYINSKDITSSQLLKQYRKQKNYQLCAKVNVEPVRVFDGELSIVKKTVGDYDGAIATSESLIKVRVYEPIKNCIEQAAEQIMLVPLTSFKWDVKGGSYPWVGQERTQLFIDDIKQASSFSEPPVITCPGLVKPSTDSYQLKLQNPASFQLLFPVFQTSSIIVKCELPSSIDVGLWKRNGEHRVLEKQTIYIYPRQSFNLSLTPLPSNPELQNYYNVSNVVYKYSGTKHAKIVEHPSTKGNNSRFITYDNAQRKTSDLTEEDSIIITSSYVMDPASKQIVYFQQPIERAVSVKTIEPLHLEFKLDGQEIVLPKSPNNFYRITVANPKGEIDAKRFKVVCDDPLVAKCFKQGDNLIVIASSKSTGRTYLRVIDELALDSPEIMLPVNIVSVDGLDLTVAGREKSSSTEQWVFEQQELTATVEAYSFNSSNANKRIPIHDLSPESISMQVSNVNNEGNIQQISRTFDEKNSRFIIKYKTSKVENQKEETIINMQATMASSESGGRKSSNRVTVKVYPKIGVKGAKMMDKSSVSIQSPQILNLNVEASLMESCMLMLRITGGPDDMITKIKSNPSQGYFYRIIKVSERIYKIEAIEVSITRGQQPSKITGNERNLLTLSIFSSSNFNQQVGIIRCLINVQPIENFHILGNRALLAGKQSRYIVDSSKQMNDLRSSGESQCIFQYKWEVKKNEGYLKISSNPERIGVNVTANQIKSLDTEPSADLIVSIRNSLGKQIGKAIKKVTIVSEEVARIFKYQQNDDELNLINDNDHFLLIPPNSGLLLTDKSKIENLSPCGQAESGLIIENNFVTKELLTGKSEGKVPVLVKLTAIEHSKGLDASFILPSYLNVLVTDICGVYVHNTDGLLIVNPMAGTAAQDSSTLVDISLLDCYGRQFPFYRNLKNVNIKAFIRNSSVASAQIHSKTGQIALWGHKIGNTELTVEVLLDGVFKAMDIIPVEVSVLMQPSSPISIHIGDMVQFQIPKESLQMPKEMFQWKSDHENILKVNKRTGEALGLSVGETVVRFGNMFTTVSVVQLIRIVKGAKPSAPNKYAYQLTYKGVLYPQTETIKQITNLLEWKCEIEGKDSQYFTATATTPTSKSPSQKTLKMPVTEPQIICQVERLPHKIIHHKIEELNIRVTASNRMVNFIYTIDFVEDKIGMFIILTERTVSTRLQPSPYHIIVNTNDRLDVTQTGGSDHCITGNDFNGARQIIAIEFAKCSKIAEWKVNILNPKTKQSDSVTISNKKIDSEAPSETDKKSKGEWKWTDILVLFMAINFLAICAYQLTRGDQGNHSKVY